MSTNWVADIAEMHIKFGVREAVASFDKDKLRAYLDFRIKFLEEELNELKSSQNSEDAVDALVDLCVVAIGTLDVMQLNSYEAWNRVHDANMAKEVGIKASRPNKLGLPDLIKPEGWEAPVHHDNVGLFEQIDFPLIQVAVETSIEVATEVVTESGKKSRTKKA